MVSGFNHIDLGSINLEVSKTPIAFNKDISDKLNSFKNGKMLYAIVIADESSTSMLFSPAYYENNVYLYTTDIGKQQLILQKVENDWYYVIIEE